LADLTLNLGQGPFKTKWSALPKSKQKGKKKRRSMTPIGVRNILPQRQKRKSSDPNREEKIRRLLHSGLSTTRSRRK